MRQEKQEFLKKIKKEINEIKKEGKIEDIKIEPVKEKKSKKYSLKKGALIGATALALATTNVPIKTTDGSSKTLIEAEAAKKDKKKPVLTFKGKTKMVVQENESIKIPKTTAKDNKDGNVTKKIKVTVKKGKKNYAGLAKKIKNNKPVTFTDAGKYVITYTVSDKAGNKATKKRYITVTEGLTTTETVTTEAPVTRRAPARVQQIQTTEAPTTSAPATTEAPTTEAPKPSGKVMPTPEEYANYDIKEISYNGITYKYTTDEKMEAVLNTFVKYDPSTGETYYGSDKINISIENDFSDICFSSENEKSVESNVGYLKHFGNVKAYDSDGNDISNSILIYTINVEGTDNYTKAVFVFAQDDKNNRKVVRVNLSYYSDFNNFVNTVMSDPTQKYEYIDTDPLCIGIRRGVYSKSLSTKNKIKKLENVK